MTARRKNRGAILHRDADHFRAIVGCQTKLVADGFTWSAEATPFGTIASDAVRMSDQAGFSTIAAMDHFFQIPIVGQRDEPMLDGYTFLGFAAGITEHAALQLLVTGVTYRHPGLLAKIVTTLDVLSNGRAKLGIGAAWFYHLIPMVRIPILPVTDTDPGSTYPVPPFAWLAAVAVVFCNASASSPCETLDIPVRFSRTSSA